MRTADLATGMREDRLRIDFSQLRRERRKRVFDAMDRLGLDACVFGREANSRYLAGPRRLWTSNTRPFMPKAIAIRNTGRVHLLTTSASTEDAPEEVPVGDLFGTSFDPTTVLATLGQIEGLAGARRIGVDGLTRGMRALLGRVSPPAGLVGAEAMIRQLRRVKLPAEIECIRVAIAITESALQVAADALEPGITGHELQGRHFERLGQLGTSTFGQQGIFGVCTGDEAPMPRSPEQPLQDGDLVVLSGGALWSGYEGSLARTWLCGSRKASGGREEIYPHWQRTMNALRTQCRPGRSGADLRQAWVETRGHPPLFPIAYGMGLGHEGPIAGSAGGPALDRQQILEPGMVVALRSWIPHHDQVFLGEEAVLITEAEPELLTRMGHGPLARMAALDREG